MNQTSIFSEVSQGIFNHIFASNSPSESIIQDFAVIMIVASIMALISFKLKQPMVVAYLLAGIIIGPHTPPFSLIVNSEILNVFAEIGIILLLFVIGMEFPIEKLKNVGRKATIVAISEAGGTFMIGYFVVQLMGFSFYDSMFVALAISATSTVIVMKILEELKVVQDNASYLIAGIAVIEDIIIISLLAVLQSVASSGNLSLVEIAVSISLVIAFVVGTIVIGSKIVPKYVNRIGKFQHDELLIVGVLGIAFGLSVIAFKLGISVATGAFFAGVLIAESKFRMVTKFIASPIRDMFAALFFISVGALMDISQLPLFILPVVVLILVRFATKFVAVWLSVRAQKFDKSTSYKVGFGLSTSGGEMSLIVAKGGSDIGSTSAFVLPFIGAITIITTFLSPYIIRLGWKFAESLQKKAGEKTST